MRMLLVIVGGILLFGAFLLSGKLFNAEHPGVIVGARLFIIVWFVITLINMWIGVTRAGYTVVPRLPIFSVVFTVPVIVSTVTIWQLSGASSAPLPTHQQEGATMSIILQPALQSAINAINAGDEEAFVAAFSPIGIVNDWGRILKGTDGVRSWARSDAIGAKARMTVLEATTTGDTTHIVFDWKSSVFNGRSEAYVTILDGLITEFRIPAK